MRGPQLRKLQYSPDSAGGSRAAGKSGHSAISASKSWPEPLNGGDTGVSGKKVSNAFRAVSHIVQENREKPKWVPSVIDSRAIGKLLVETNEVHIVLPSIKPGAQMAVFFGYYLCKPHIEFRVLAKEYGKPKATSALVTVSRQLGRWCRDYWEREMSGRLWAVRGFFLQPMPEEKLEQLLDTSKVPSNWVPSVPASRAIAAILFRCGETDAIRSQMVTPVMSEMLEGYFISNPPRPFGEFSDRFGKKACQGAIMMVGRRLGKWYREYLKRNKPENDSGSE